jgi:glycogen debranching enzyme
MARILVLILLAGDALVAGALTYSRTVRPWEFLDAVGQQASILGQENGTLEAYVYPLKLFSELRFSFEIGGRLIPGSAIARRVSFSTGSTQIVYSGDEFRVTETLIVPVHYPGAVIRLDVEAHDPVTIHFSLKPDFQLMWPAAFGSAFGQWKPDTKVFAFGADGKPYAAVLGSPDITINSIDYATNYSARSTIDFSLGTVNGAATRTLAFAGSTKSLEEALSAQRRLLQQAEQFQAETTRYYESYLAETVSIDLPDKNLQTAYDWSRLSLVKGLVENPFLGTGLVAGYGPSKGSYRPGFAWFFGRDSFWSSFALNSAGDWRSSRKAIEFVSRFQRDDGKIPHEISQSAAQVAWSKDYPYEYASADATPLFVIAVRDYVQHSGDLAFATAMWEHVQKAMAFLRSTLDSDGFAKNYGVGHGWVEGGPLLPVRVEFYMAGCYVEALRSLAELAKWTGHNEMVDEYEKRTAEQQRKLDQLFWLQQSGTYAFAIGNDGKPLNQPTVLSLVPEWWRLLPLERVQRMIVQLADESHASDWGMRIISSRSPVYNPAGYHFGSVWPLFTGWASLGEYHAHKSAAGFANLKANSWLTVDGAGGNTTEVLSGETYSPLSTATPHQIWSAAMVISPVLRGLFGLEVDSIARRVALRPHLPPDWTDSSATHVGVAAGHLDFQIHRTMSGLTLKIENQGAGSLKILFAPAYSPYTTVTAATLNNRPVKFSRENGKQDWHPVIEATIPEGATTIAIRHARWFGVALPADPPQLAETSSNLKLLDEQWDNENKRVTLTFSGLTGHTYQFTIAGSDNITRLQGAEQRGDRIELTMPSGSGYVRSQVVVDLR